MPDKDGISRVNRRNILKAIGGASALATFGTAVQALGGPEKAERIRDATETDSFEAFESEFGPISVDGEASTVTRIGDGDDVTERVELQTSIGEMGVIFVERADLALEIALLDLSTVVEDAVPETYTAIPDDTRPLLIASSDHDGFEFRRDATAEEKRVLSKRTGIPGSHLQANLESIHGGFVVADDRTVQDGDYVVVALDDVVMGEVTGAQIGAATVVDDPVTPNLSWWCRYKCGSCLAKAAKCLGCCLSTSLLCIACIIWQCGLGANSCYDCHGCLE